MAFLTTTLPATDRLVGALCNTLVHSLWQGLILATITGLIVLSTRKATAALRYNLLISALALFAVGVGITFAVQLQQAQPVWADASQVDIGVPVNIAMISTSIATAAPTQSFSENLFGYLNQHHNMIVLVWFLIICAKSIQLIVGLLGVSRLKNTNVHQVSVEWYNRMQELAKSLNIDKKIALLESGLAKVPMMLGTFKPVILIPIGLLTALSTAEVEAILVHELAHIKRRDYLVNLLQSLMEIIFFFNPAVLWISQVIKTERENCCDDLAVAQSSNKVNYIRALVSCEEYQSAVPAYAMSFAGDKNTLINRVKRIASNRNHTLNLFEKTALAICLVISGLCLSAFSQKEKLNRITDTIEQAISHKEVDDLKPAKPIVFSPEKEKLTQQTTLVEDYSANAHIFEGDVKPLGVNSCGPCDTNGELNAQQFGEQLSNAITKNVADSHFAEHLSDIISKANNAVYASDPVGKIISRDLAAARPGENVNDKIAKDVAALHLSDHINARIAKAVADAQLNEKLNARIVKAIAAEHLNERYAAGVNKQLATAQRDKAKHAADTSKHNINADLSALELSLSQKNANINNVKVNANVQVDIDTPKAQAKTVVYFANGQANYEPNRPYNADTKLNTSIPVVVGNKYAAGRYIAYIPDTNKKTKKITFTKTDIKTNTIKMVKVNSGQVDLAKEVSEANLIKDKKNFKIILNNKEMLIDGIKQPESIHQNFLKKYQKDPSDNVNVTVSVTN